ncbi:MULTISPECIES: helix-turn-helix transcriptional regulator [unclassified Ruminococcus]|uniref:helix-turn-helix domain-containing protein n=1 Tax=unclassified Ruminococcus TaxID=2608920 RepID=UPI00319DF14E
MTEKRTLTDMLESLPAVCRQQRKYMGMTQKDAADLLYDKYGLKKDPSKISQFESGKVLFPDFLSEYCELLGLDFFLPEYKRRKVKMKLMNEEVINHAIRQTIYGILNDIGNAGKEGVDYCLDIRKVNSFYIGIVCWKALFTENAAKICYLHKTALYAFRIEEDSLVLCGRMNCCQAEAPFWNNLEYCKEIACYLDSESGTYGEMGLYMAEVVAAHAAELKKAGKEEFGFQKGTITYIDDTYVYEDERRKGCFTALMKSAGILKDQNPFENTWIACPFPLYLSESEDRLQELEYYFYAESEEEDRECGYRNVNILKKFGATDIVPLCDATNGRFPFVVCNSLYREYADIYGNDPEKLENILEKYDI